MKRDRIIAGTSAALSLLIGVWLVLNWTSDQPAPVKAREAMPNQAQPVEVNKALESLPAHAQVLVLPPPPPPPASHAILAAAKPARKIEALKPAAKPVPKPVFKQTLKPSQPVAKSEPADPIQPIQTEKPKQLEEQEPPALDIEAFRTEGKAPAPEKFDALARFKAMHAPREQAEAKVKPFRAPAPSQPARAEVSANAEITGRVALRILEHGEGPEIELAWPHSARASTQLYRLFTRCYGMRTAAMDSTGQLYTAALGPRPWPINLDRYSGFVRQVSGRLAPEEASELRALQKMHWSRVTSVRIFPRSVDARLLGGLGQLLGKSYRSMGHIRATYRMLGAGVVVGGISADGKPVAGEIVLRPLTRRCSA
ncbi:MAG: hypothetical protein VYE18_04880 [Pseudomonadota bacterium]|nr:hypothetical protein [Pseudomonadota bacterium]